MDHTEYINNKRKEIREILSGKLKPIQSSVILKSGEHAYYEFETVQMADLKQTTSHQSGQARSPLIKGGLLRGNTQFSSTITRSHYYKNEICDRGLMLFTNMRILFIGKEALSIYYRDLLSIHFPNPAKPHYPDVKLTIDVRYPKMLKNESYTLHNPQAELYFRGIMRNIKKDTSSVKEDEVDKFMNDKFIFSKKIVVTINADGSINCPCCDSVVKDYMEGKTFSLFGKGRKWRRYICPHCNRFISNALKDVEYSNLV